MARATSTRERTSSLRKMFRMWLSTVFRLRNSSAAISGFVLRSTTSRATWSSRSLSVATPVPFACAGPRATLSGTAELAQLALGLVAVADRRRRNRTRPRRVRTRPPPVLLAGLRRTLARRASAMSRRRSVADLLEGGRGSRARSAARAGVARVELQCGCRTSRPWRPPSAGPRSRRTPGLPPPRARLPRVCPPPESSASAARGTGPASLLRSAAARPLPPSRRAARRHCSA